LQSSMSSLYNASAATWHWRVLFFLPSYLLLINVRSLVAMSSCRRERPDLRGVEKKIPVLSGHVFTALRAKKNICCQRTAGGSYLRTAFPNFQLLSTVC
ncbi:hypothetical protein, partial [Rhizobium sp. Leaf311]|uniref:hypothetical protein n=1 Tax=Rhizobium sp. Leaf311 TaxID=1736332 RepID=UPI001AECFDAD